MTDAQSEIMRDADEAEQAARTAKAERQVGEMLDAVQQAPDDPPPLDPCLTTFASGATRSNELEGLRYDLIPFVSLRRLAARYGMGAATHGDRNWEGGVPASETANHAVQHLFKWLAGDRSEDHLAAAAWGCFALMFYEDNRPECIDTPGGGEGEEG